MLDWAIYDKPTCEDAAKEKDTYACADHAWCNNNTDDDFGGYFCQCGDGQGNPYDKSNGGGCQAVGEVVLSPHSNCPKICGNISVPFPFGIGSGCFREIGFNLSCKGSKKSHQLFYGQNRITKLSVAEGKMEGINSTDKFPFISQEPSSANIVDTHQRSSDNHEWEWAIEKISCEEAVGKNATYACVSNYSECYQASIDGIDGTNDYGYRCKCKKGYEGNPYIHDGCTDIDECNTPEKYGCNGTCINVPGNYKCFCPSGRQVDPWRACYPVKNFFTVRDVIIGVSTASALILLFLSMYFLCRRWKERTLRRIKEKHFHKNRGLFLQQLISSNNDLAERTKIFSLEELEKATNFFDETRILGCGGHGTVYKGILANQRISAIKKAKIAKQKEIDEFINEVVILSQINHKNVVRLFGCCLESEVPLLVYEFIPNGTLNNHLERHSSLSWEERQRIATETSGALAYLHSSTSISIFHRDVKSSNILLDDNCTAKISDFGASRSLPPDQSHLTTIVQGTFGYMDPEYYQTGQLTEKSDVYSFGVILVELLTGQKPISSGRSPEEINLCSRFLLARREKQFFQLLETRVKEEGTKEELTTIAMLAEKCLDLRGDERPTMKEVEAILEGLRRTKNKKRDTTNEHHGLCDDLQSESSNSYHQKLVEAFDVIDAKSRDSLSMLSLEKEFILSLDWPR